MSKKKSISISLVFLFTFMIIFQNVSLKTLATTNEMTIVNDSTITGDSNKFQYFGSGWGSGTTTGSYNGAGDEHYNDINTGAVDATSKYYTIEFIGNKIEVYGHKSWNHGIIKYSVDGGEFTEVSSYAATRTGNQLLYTAENLSEGKHTLTAIATGKSESTKGKAVIQVDYAKVYHAKYAVSDIITSATNVELVQGAEQSIKTSFIPSYAVAADLTYTSVDTKVATVDNTGKISAVGVGNTTITVSSAEFGISKNVTVTVKSGKAQIQGSIVDTNTHYTQEKYNDVKAMGLLSKDLFAWKGDKAISEIALISKESVLNNVTISTGDFTSGNNILAKENVKATFLKETLAYVGHPGYHNQNDISMPVGEKKSVPDVLYTSDPVNIKYNNVQPVWVEFNVPEGTQAGIYTGTINVSADGIDTPLVFTYNVEVLDAIMPKTNSYNFDFEAWQYPYSSAEYYNVEPFSQKHLDILKPHMLKYKELGGTAITTTIVEEAWGGQTYSKNPIRYPSMIKWTKKADGSFTFNFSDFDKWVKFNKDLGIGDKIVCYSMIPWGNKIIYFNEATNAQENITLTPGTATYETIWLQFLNALVPHLDEKGWFNDTYIGIDERSNMASAFDVIDKVKNKDNLVLKKSAAMDHFTASYLPVTDRVDDLSVGSISAKTDLAGYKAFVQKRKDAEKDYKTTIYTCTGHFPNSLTLSMPGESYWTMLFTAAQGGTGYMRWAFDAWVEDPLRDTTHWAFEAGDTSLIYPDEKNAANPTSKSSVRLEKMAEGIRDVNKLYSMVKEIPTLKADVDALLATVVTNYTGTANGIGEKGGMTVATDATRARLPQDMEALRIGIKTISKKYIQLKETTVDRVDSISLNKSSVNLQASKTEAVVATVMPENTRNKNVIWTSSNNAIATVDKLGNITAVSAGEAKITATSEVNNSIAKDVTVTVTMGDNTVNQIAYYSFDNIVDNKVKDSWNSYDGVVAGAQVIDGKVGKALQFNNDSDDVTITSPTTLDKNWTLSMWVKKGDIKNLPASIMWDGRPFQNTDKLSESIDIARDTTGNMGVSVNTGFLTVKTVVAKDEWVNLAWVNDKAVGLTVYVDGVSAGTNAWTKTNAFNAPLKIIGGRNYIGAIDEVRVYNKALTKAEIDENRKVPGLTVNTKLVDIKVNETSQIIPELISNNENKTILYKSDNENVATVNASGLITGKAYGNTFVTVLNEATGFMKRVDVYVNKNMEIGYTIPQYNYPTEKQIVVDRQAGQYLGQPDMIKLDDDKTLLTVYPKGHGIGPAILKKSIDGGITWSDRLPTNPTWVDSMETPTIYNLKFVNGTTKQIQISGGPGWGNGFKGWTSSLSSDNGETWSDYKRWGDGKPVIVGMASLIQLKDNNGNFIDKWMGVYHDYSYVNYRSYLTFDENGNEQWSNPEPYLSEWRDVESKTMLCEVGMFRSPDGNQLVMLARSQSHKNKSTLAFSNDEGKTWTRPREVQGALNGERHKITYDPISGRIVVTFREITLDYNKNGIVEDNDWVAGDWIAWVGTYDDLVNGKEGEYRIRLAEDFTPSVKSGDTGYAGSVVLNDGTFVMDSYGYFDKKDVSKPYIVAVRFKLGEIDNALGKVDKSKLLQEIAYGESLNSELYTVESLALFNSELANAKKDSGRNDIQQIEVNSRIAKLIAAKNSLVLKPQEILVSTIRNLKATIDVNYVTLSWDEPVSVVGLEGYTIYVDGKEFAKIAKGTNTAIVNNLRANTIYGLKVTARYSNGAESKPVSINIRTKVSR